ncbi:MAG: S-methyl-5'-thioadenosine phosphorylase [Candidatus Nanoarchaeia archaeon]
MVKIGIIGGSGLDDPQLIQDYKEKDVDTPYGKPSSPLTCGKIHGVEVVILARHGKHHSIMPSKVNFKANIWALYQEGCTHILATTAVGSLKEEIKPGNLVFPSQLIDFTRLRELTFFTDKVVHTPMADPFDEKLRKTLIKCAEELSLNYNKNVTLITIEGPRFSTKAESKMFRLWGADIINMSSCPETALANELAIPYQAIAMATDYDCIFDDRPSVTFEEILETMSKNAEKVKQLLVLAIKKLKSSGTEANEEMLKEKIRTIPDFPKAGIMFRDVTTLLKDPEGFNLVVELLMDRYKAGRIDKIVGIESRGFIIGGALAHRLNVGFVPARKKGKLPHKTIKAEYELEYGKDVLEIHEDAIVAGERVLIVDDLVATAGTCLAATTLVEQCGGKVVECCFIIELPALKGRKRLEEKGYSVFSLVKFEGE